VTTRKEDAKLENLSGFWTAIVTIAPAVIGAIGVLLTRERQPRLYRNIARQADLLAKLPPAGDAYAEVQALLNLSAAALRERETGAIARKLNPTNVVLSIILSALAGTAAYFLVLWCTSTWGSPWGVVAIVATVIVGLFLALLVGAAFTTIFNPPTPKKQKVIPPTATTP
jgi:hypothetical protein